MTLEEEANLDAFVKNYARENEDLGVTCCKVDIMGNTHRVGDVITVYTTPDAREFGFSSILAILLGSAGVSFIARKLNATHIGSLRCFQIETTPEIAIVKVSELASYTPLKPINLCPRLGEVVCLDAMPTVV